MIKIATVVGARPQFIKAAMVTRAFAQIQGQTTQAGASEQSQDSAVQEIMIHTGQHYDANMSQVFFNDLGLPSPQYNLGVGSSTHGKQTGLMLMRLEEVLLQECPDAVLTYGDTNSTLAGAIAASKLHIPLVHVEAGLRSFNKAMPEEINRILTDHAADILFCPTLTAVQNLQAEGITTHVYQVGDVMYDAALYFSAVAEQKSSILQDHSILEPFYLATIHRQENTDDPERLGEILAALSALDAPVVSPVHPRTEKVLRRAGSQIVSNDNGRVICMPPVSFLDMLVLEKHARVILTDSGGVQKEAFFFKVPCITLRDETEWVETVAAGMNRLAGANKEKIINAVKHSCAPRSTDGQASPGWQPFGDGKAAVKIVELLRRLLPL
jgi:UDP-N-acetylglucosamine 2-epimerase